MAAGKFVYFMLAALLLGTINAAPAENGHLIKLPDACKGQVFCNIKPDNYDAIEEKINSVLPELLVKDYADRNGADTPSTEPRLSPEEDWHNCPYITKTQSMFLYNHGGNDTNIDVFVQTKLFKQYIDVVTCATQHIQIDSDEQCFQGLGVSAFHMKSKCETTTAQRTLYVYDIKTSKVVQKSFEVPACCTCKVTYK